MCFSLADLGAASSVKSEGEGIDSRANISVSAKCENSGLAPDWLEVSGANEGNEMMHHASTSTCYPVPTQW